MKLAEFSNESFDRGAPLWKEALWIVVQALSYSTPVPGSGWRRWLLRTFGARVDDGVVIKPRGRVKFPWRLDIGRDCWIGEAAWIDNLQTVTLGHDVCVSQGAYLCTGNHDWSARGFDLRAEPISIEAHAWIGARASVGPGVTVHQGAVLTLGSVAASNLDAWTISAGNPARKVSDRPNTAAA